MSFAEWLGEHIRSDMLVQGEKSNRRTFVLSEYDDGVRINLRIENVPDSATVLKFDRGERRKLFRPEKVRNFLKRCDFLILDERHSDYRAIFVELKRSFGVGESGRQFEDKGEEQLRWSLPSLKFLLSVFEVDRRRGSSGKNIEVTYFLIAKCPNQWYRKRKTREHFRIRHHEGIVVNYSIMNKIKFGELVSRRDVSAA